jgi:hypothetical protein
MLSSSATVTRIVPKIKSLKEEKKAFIVEDRVTPITITRIINGIINEG